jgi:hypothetical protein
MNVTEMSYAQHQMKRFQRLTRLLPLSSPCINPKRPRPPLNGPASASRRRGPLSASPSRAEKENAACQPPDPIS